ncbi:MAG: hypothetical protein J0L97_08375 [Alphaproteobacteria bacterium]|nr:hypothetical protein [Alphaproteobacteria bacterium]
MNVEDSSAARLALLALPHEPACADAWQVGTSDWRAHSSLPPWKLEQLHERFSALTTAIDEGDMPGGRVGQRKNGQKLPDPQGEELARTFWRDTAIRNILYLGARGYTELEFAYLKLHPELVREGLPESRKKCGYALLSSAQSNWVIHALQTQILTRPELLDIAVAHYGTPEAATHWTVNGLLSDLVAASLNKSGLLMCAEEIYPLVRDLKDKSLEGIQTAADSPALRLIR